MAESVILGADSSPVELLILHFIQAWSREADYLFNGVRKQSGNGGDSNCPLLGQYIFCRLHFSAIEWPGKVWRVPGTNGCGVVAHVPIPWVASRLTSELDATAGLVEARTERAETRSIQQQLRTATRGALVPPFCFAKRMGHQHFVRCVIAIHSRYSRSLLLRRGWAVRLAAGSRPGGGSCVAWRRAR